MGFIKQKGKCAGCSEKKYCRDTSASWVFFIIGILATIAVRAVGILDNYGPGYTKAAWYTGIIGFFIFFVYKYRTDTRRALSVQKSGVMKKLGKAELLSPGDYELLSSVLCSVTTSKDRINYFFIFSTSVVTLAAAIYLDLVK